MSSAGVLKEDDRLESIEGDILAMSPIGGQHIRVVNRLFDGVEYASVEAMAPDVRAAFDKYRQQAEQQILAELGEATGDSPGAVAPAWGGPRAPGLVPVPVEFDPVTSLGPATAVYEHEELQLPSFGPPRPKALVIYRDGLAYHTGAPDLHTWRWEDVAVIRWQALRLGVHPGHQSRPRPVRADLARRQEIRGVHLRHAECRPPGAAHRPQVL